MLRIAAGPKSDGLLDSLWNGKCVVWSRSTVCLMAGFPFIQMRLPSKWLLTSRNNDSICSNSLIRGCVCGLQVEAWRTASWVKGATLLIVASSTARPAGCIRRVSCGGAPTLSQPCWPTHNLAPNTQFKTPPVGG